MDKVNVTPEDMADIVVRMAQLGLPSDVQGVLLHGNNRGTVPSRILERALSDFLARHRHAAMLKGVRLGLEAAKAYLAQGGDRDKDGQWWAWDTETWGYASAFANDLSRLDPAAILGQRREG